MNMETTTQTPVDFMQLFVEQLLDQLGFAELSDESRQPYMVQFIAELERRIGLALEAELNETDITALNDLLASGEVSADQMTAFWQSRVPEYDSIVNDAMASFARDMQQTAASL